MSDFWRRKAGLIVPAKPEDGIYRPPGICDLNFEHMLMAANGARGTGNDPYFANVSLLLQPKSTDADGTILDYSNNAATVNKTGNITTSATGAYYASTKTLISDGSGDAASCAAISAYNLTGVDFTAEALIYLNNNSNNRIFEQNTTDFNNGHALYTSSGGSAGKLRYSLNAAAASIIDITGTTTMSTATWYYCAIVRSGNNFTLYLNGNVEGTATSAVGPVNYTSNFTVCASATGTTSSLNGDMNFFRLTKGVARVIGGIPGSPLPYS